MVISKMILIYVNCLLPWSGEPPDPRESLDPEALTALIKRLADPPSATTAMAQIRTFPQAMVVSKLVHAMNHDPGFRTPAARATAYRVLFESRAAETREGFKQIITGLDDSVGRSDCIAALRLTPVEDREVAVAVLAPLVRDSELAPETLVQVLQTLAFFESSAASLAEPIKAIIRRQDGNPTLSWAAFYALLRIAATDSVLPLLAPGDSDPATLKGALLALGKFGLETEGGFDGAPATADRVRQLVAELASRGEADIRLTAVDTLPQVFGKEAFVREAEAYRINPSLERVLQDIARHDQDQTVRSRAERALGALKRDADRRGSHMEE